MNLKTIFYLLLGRLVTSVLQLERKTAAIEQGQALLSIGPWLKHCDISAHLYTELL